jgi:hypothetical protein
MATKRNRTDDGVRNILANSDLLIKLAEENIKKELVESFSPQIKKAIAGKISEGFDLDDDLEEGYGMFEDDDMEATDDAEMEVDADVETGEDMEVEPVATGDTEMGDYSDDASDEDSMEEADELDDLPMEESDEDEFLRELANILEADDDDMGDDEEVEVEEEPMEEGTDYDNLDEAEDMEMDEDYAEWKKNIKPTIKTPYDMNEAEEMELDEDYAEWKKNVKPSIKKPYDMNESKKAVRKSNTDSEMNRILAENRKLRNALNTLNKNTSEIILDLAKKNAYKDIVNTHNLKESTKLHVLTSIDDAKSEREVSAIAGSLKKVLRSQLKEANRNVAPKNQGRNRLLANKNDIKVKRTVKESVEKKSNQIINESWVNRLVELADIKPEKNN